MSTITYNDIVKYKETIDNNKTNLDLVLKAYKDRVTNISSDVNGIVFTDWEDDISSNLSDYKDEIKVGLVGKLESSISTNGSLKKFKDLIDALYEQCDTYLANVSSIKEQNSAFSYNADGDVISSDNSYDESLSTVNRTLSSDRDTIYNTLLELKKLRFDSIIDTEEQYASISSLANYTVMSSIVEPVIINQFDKVVVYLEGEGEKEMFYLGTDSQGRSYFSETLDDNSKAYRTVLPGQATTAQTYLNDPETYSDPLTASAFAEARFAFVILGGNTGDMTKGNVLEKWFGSYANGYYVDDTNFNNSIVFDDPKLAPDIIERGSNEYDWKNSFHVTNIDVSSCVPLNDVLNSSEGFNTEEHPNIILNPGDKIESTYNIRLGDWEWFFGWDTYTIGSDTDSVILTWNDDKQAYYVVTNGTYYTANHNMGRGIEGGEGKYYIKLDKLNGDRVTFYLNGSKVK